MRWLSMGSDSGDLGSKVYIGLPPPLTMSKQEGVSWKVVGFVIALVVATFLIASYMTKDVWYSPDDEAGESELTTMYAEDGTASSDGTSPPADDGTTTPADIPDTSSSLGDTGSLAPQQCCGKVRKDNGGCAGYGTDAACKADTDCVLKASC